MVQAQYYPNIMLKSIVNSARVNMNDTEKSGLYNSGI